MSESQQVNLLLVDDRPENLLAMEGALEDLHCQIFKANSGPEALRMVLKHEFDLILLDVQMPGMDGFEVAELLRGKKQSRDIPIVFITAISKEQKYIQRGYEVGAENYLFKPIDPEDLRKKVKVTLDFHQYRKKMREIEIKQQEKKAG